ncbi:MAG TPA: CTP synthase [Dehalococcoidia bacterium]|nr:CTP synthase [Dehalococcoidia bacterium]
MPKYIFVTGGVVSSVGKGITTAALGRILKSRNVSVSIQKLDPYLNVDPGTMSPYQHGEVFVTSDGAETDLDLGHYERFIDEELTKASSVTTGQIYQTVIAKERKGEFLGGTIQAIPHVTNEIKARVRQIGRETGAQVVIVEVGGTVGDIEGQPFLEAIRQIRREERQEDTLSIHVTFLPHVGSTNELKTKPTQHSVRELRSAGIQPDVILCRADHEVTAEIRRKIALFCDVDERGVISLPTMESIYQVPIVLQDENLGDYVIEMMKLDAAPRDLAGWREMVERMQSPSGSISIAVIGKYVELHDAYLSIKEALIHAGIAHQVRVELSWIHSERLEQEPVAALIDGADGILVCPGFGGRGIEGKIEAARYARENKIPYLGVCLGLQMMVIDYARNVLGLTGANSTEVDQHTPHPVISMLSEQLGIEDLGGTMRLGGYPCKLVPGTQAAAAYGVDEVVERHRHRYEFNNKYREEFARAGLIASGVSPDESLVEIMEVAGHPFMLGSQFHPEFRSRPDRPQPLFRAFIGAAKSLRAGRDAGLLTPERAKVSAAGAGGS